MNEMKVSIGRLGNLLTIARDTSNSIIKDGEAALKKGDGVVAQAAVINSTLWAIIEAIHISTIAICERMEGVEVVEARLDDLESRIDQVEPPV